MESEAAARLEEDFVFSVYDRIASHFDQTRHSQWGGVKRFLATLPPSSIVLDVGCGNGKYLVQDGLIKMGCDRSVELCKICNDKGFSVFAADCLQLPVVNGRFDAVLSIAVLHHLASEQRRLSSLQELLRVLRPGGRAMIYVWAFEQRRMGKASNYLKKDHVDAEDSMTRNELDQANGSTPEIGISEVVKLPVHNNRREFQAQDVLVPWTRKQKRRDDDCDQNNETYLRFYHVFREGELESMCSSVGGCTVLESYYEQGNWCVVLEKL